jgi:hypothetical protein
MKIRFSDWCTLAKKNLAQRHSWIALRTILVLLMAVQFITEPGIRIAATMLGVLAVGWLYDSLWRFARDVYRVALHGEYGPDRVARD